MDDQHVSGVRLTGEEVELLNRIAELHDANTGGSYASPSATSILLAVWGALPVEAVTP